MIPGEQTFTFVLHCLVFTFYEWSDGLSGEKGEVCDPEIAGPYCQLTEGWNRVK